jgi:hypothetical protein
MQLIRLWGHECTRVFADRLADESELAWFDRLLTDSLSRHVEVKWSQVQELYYTQQAALVSAAAPNTGTTDSPTAAASAAELGSEDVGVAGTATVADGSARNALLFSDFADPSAVKRGYHQVVSDLQLAIVLQHYLREYNSVNYKCVPRAACSMQHARCCAPAMPVDVACCQRAACVRLVLPCVCTSAT